MQMESPRPDDKEALRSRLEELKHMEEEQADPIKLKDEPPIVTPPPELSSLNYRYLRQYLSPGEAVTITSQPRNAGPWHYEPVFEHTFQSSKPNVRITVTPRHGKAVEYLFTPNPYDGLPQITPQ